MQKATPSEAHESSLRFYVSAPAHLALDLSDKRARAINKTSNKTKAIDGEASEIRAVECAPFFSAVCDLARKENHSNPQGFAREVARLLEKRALEHLGLLYGAGLLRVGFMQCLRALEEVQGKDEPLCLITAKEGAADAHKLQAKARARGLALYDCFGRNALSAALGRGTDKAAGGAIHHVVVLKTKCGRGDKFARKLALLYDYESEAYDG